MCNLLTKQILTEHHRSAGLELMDDDHCVYLRQRMAGFYKLVAVFSSLGVTAESLGAEADRFLSESQARPS